MHIIRKRRLEQKKIKHGFTIIALFCTVFMGRGAGYLQENSCCRVCIQKTGDLALVHQVHSQQEMPLLRSSQNTMLFYIGNADEKTIYLTFDCFMVMEILVPY